MNKIVFEKYLKESNGTMLPVHLTLPPVIPKLVPYKGLLELEANKGVKEV